MILIYSLLLVVAAFPSIALHMGLAAGNYDLRPGGLYRS